MPQLGPSQPDRHLGRSMCMNTRSTCSARAALGVAPDLARRPSATGRVGVSDIVRRVVGGATPRASLVEAWSSCASMIGARGLGGERLAIL